MVPASPKQKEIPFARVNHNKYMVTDKVAYIGKAAHRRHGSCGSSPTHEYIVLYMYLDGLLYHTHMRAGD